MAKFLSLVEKRCSGLIGPNINVTGTIGYYGDLVYVGCILGYYTIENETTYMSECAENGVWSVDKQCFGKILWLHVTKEYTCKIAQQFE